MKDFKGKPCYQVHHIQLQLLPSGTDSGEGPAAKRKSVVEPIKFRLPVPGGIQGAGSALLDKLTRKVQEVQAERAEMAEQEDKMGLPPGAMSHVAARAKIAIRQLGMRAPSCIGAFSCSRISSLFYCKILTFDSNWKVLLAKISSN